MKTLGLDIGGANLKAAHSDGGAFSQPFALWTEPEALTGQLVTLLRRVPSFDRIAVTTTAELCDCFVSKREGMHHVLRAVDAIADDRTVDVWSTEGRFMTVAEARNEFMACAASNWHALASYVAQRHPTDALLIDVGSTTTDVIRLADGRVAADGLNDMQRLASGELIYLGVVRTPLSALGPTIGLNGQQYNLMAEQFATTHDVFLLTGALSPQPSSTDTADGRPATVPCAAARVVRMIGADMEMLGLDDATRLAQAFVKQFECRIAQAIRQVVAHHHIDRVIVSGSGAFAAKKPASMVLPEVPIVRLADSIGPEAATAACAYALVQLNQAS